MENQQRQLVQEMSHIASETKNLLFRNINLESKLLLIQTIFNCEVQLFINNINKLQETNGFTEIKTQIKVVNKNTDKKVYLKLIKLQASTQDNQILHKVLEKVQPKSVRNSFNEDFSEDYLPIKDFAALYQLQLILEENEEQLNSQNQLFLNQQFTNFEKMSKQNTFYLEFYIAFDQQLLQNKIIIQQVSSEECSKLDLFNNELILEFLPPSKKIPQHILQKFQFLENFQYFSQKDDFYHAFSLTQHLIKKCQIEDLNGFSVFQWNPVAKMQCDAKIFPHVSTKSLSWELRAELITDIIEQSQEFDIYCLQEIDQPEFFSQIFGKKYKTIYNGINGLVFCRVGVFMAFNQEKFTLIENSTRNFTDKDKVEKYFVKLAKLKVNNKSKNANFQVEQREVWVASLQLTPGDDQETNVIRTRQIQQVIDFINSQLKIKKYQNEQVKVGVIVCGDFITAAYTQILQTAKMLNSKNLSLATNQQKINKEIGDQIWFDNTTLQIIDFQSFPKNLKQQSLLSEEYPSSHFNLHSYFQFK